MLKAAGIVFHDAASVLFGVQGLQVTDVEAGPGGTLTVRAVTDHPAAAACQDRGAASSRVRETVLVRPRDVQGSYCDELALVRRAPCSSSISLSASFSGERTNLVGSGGVNTASRSIAVW
jgi:hypothetical protein